MDILGQWQSPPKDVVMAKRNVHHANRSRWNGWYQLRGCIGIEWNARDRRLHLRTEWFTDNNYFTGDNKLGIDHVFNDKLVDDVNLYDLYDLDNHDNGANRGSSVGFRRVQSTRWSSHERVRLLEPVGAGSNRGPNLASQLWLDLHSGRNGMVGNS